MYKLTYKHNQPKNFEIIRFPDGQQQVILDLEYFKDRKSSIMIECSIENWKEFEVLMCIVAAIKQADFLIERIEFKYLFGLRSDRIFNQGSCNYVRDVLAPIINQWEVNKSILTPHGRSLNYLPDAQYGRDFSYTWFHNEYNRRFNNYIKIAADESAVETILGFFEYGASCHLDKIRIGNEIQITSKNIDELGRYLDYRSTIPILLMDDLCDGGYTFIQCAKYLRSNELIAPDRQLDLFVMHGLFNQGIDELLKHFNKIYTTNSTKQPLGFIDDRLHVLDVWSPDE